MAHARRMKTVGFARALQRCTSRIRMHLLRTLQEVMLMSKTCNQLYCGLCYGAQSQRVPLFMRRCLLTLSPTPERGYKFCANYQTSTTVCLQRLIVGTLHVASNIGAACGPWITGVLYDATGTYGPAFVCAMGMSLVSIIAMWIAAPRHVRVITGSIAPVRAHNASQGQQ
jgi:nitrate/nitrite transporter NarK